MVQHADIDHTGIPGTGTAAITRADALPSAAPQTISSANTPTDITGCSVSLTAGTWIVFGMALLKRGAVDSVCALAIADAANAYVATARQGVIGTGGTQFCHLNTFAIVSPGSTTTYKLRATFVSGTAGTIEKSDGIHGEAATRITAIKLA